MKSKLSLLVVFSLTLLAACQPSRCMLVLMPDTQYYSLDYPEVFQSQAQWIADNADDISFVIHQGDITHNNNLAQWEVAAEAINIFSHKVPFTFVPGNHDMGNRGGAGIRNTDMMNTYLPYDHYSKSPTFGGAFEYGKMDNTWHTFYAGGIHWLILSLEFGPRNKVLNWAWEVVESHPQHTVIINTHAYLYSDNQRMSSSRNHKWLPQNYGIGKEEGEEAVNDGQQMWEKFVMHHPNILFVFSGHVLNDGTGLLISEGVHGNKVYQMLANYQTGVEGALKGGNGYLRMLNIDRKKDSVRIRTFSPYIGEYKTDPDQEFILEGLKFNK